MFTKIYDLLKRNIKFIISLVVIILLFTIELPYCIYKPGGMVDLNKRIEVEDKYESKGTFGMAYVSMVRSSIPFVLLSYVLPNWDLEKKSEVVYDDTNLDETINIDKLYMQEGINNAIMVSYKKAGKSVSVKNNKLTVSYVLKESKSNLKIKDEIISVDEKKVSSLEDVQEIINDHSAGDIINIKVKRNNKYKTVKSKITEIEDKPKLGIATINIYDLKTTPKVDIKTKDSESGPSGGLMMALEIYNELTKKDLTNGKKIIGTGTIDENGNVGKIDGVKYKLLGASRKKADIFICPKENEEEANKVKKNSNLKIKIISVDTFDDAINKLEELK